jgi:truncated hemoglobin YjbI
MAQTHFERLGGEAALRAVIEDFVGRVFSDVMIGFFFRDASQQHIAEFEYQHAAQHLGGPVVYRGRSMRQAHARHRIMGGQFARRLQILREVLADHRVPEDVAQAWLAHDETLRDQVTTDPDGQCIGG